MSVNYQFIKKKGHTVGCLHTFIVMSNSFYFIILLLFQKWHFQHLGVSLTIINDREETEKEPCVHNLEVIVVLVNNYNGF